MRLTFELVAIALCAPIGAWLLDMPYRTSAC